MRIQPLTVLVLLGLMFACTSEPKKPAQEAAAPAHRTYALHGPRGGLQNVCRGSLLASRQSAFSTRVSAHEERNRTRRKIRRLARLLRITQPSRRQNLHMVWREGRRCSRSCISFGAEDSYNPTNAFTKTFDIAFLKMDSDKAVQVANQHGGEKLVKQTPTTSIVCLAEWSTQENIAALARSIWRHW